MLPSEQYRQPESGAVLAALYEINTRNGYLPEEEMRRVARELAVPLSQLFSVATFYAAFSFKPCGRHKLQVCEGTACYVKGAAALLAYLQAKLGSFAHQRDRTHQTGRSQQSDWCPGQQTPNGTEAGKEG